MASTGSSFAFCPENLATDSAKVFFTVTLLLLATFTNLFGTGAVKFVDIQDENPEGVIIRPLPQNGNAAFQSTPAPATPVPDVVIACACSNGTVLPPVDVTPLLSFQIFADNDAWGCDFKWVNNIYPKEQSFIVYSPSGNQLPFACPLNMCMSTIDTNGFNLQQSATDYVHVYDWVELYT